MSFSSEWEQRYYENTHLSTWPWSDLVSYVHRYAKPITPKTRVLELGCGAGANIPFFLALGADYWAVDGSPTMVAQLHERFPALRDRIAVADFTRRLPFDGKFNLIIDRAAMTCNDTASIRNALSLVARVLQPGGKYIGLDWYSKDHSDSGKGREVDLYTRSDIPDGQFAGLGNVHFSDKSHLLGVFGEAGFEILRLEHKVSRWEIPVSGHQMAAWNLLAVER